MIRLLLFLSFVFSIQAGNSQSISNLQISHTVFCPGNKLNVNFETSGSFNNGNLFIAQLSASDGTFSSFQNIGSSSNKSFEVEIPNSPQSSSYKIRIISTNPISSSQDILENLILKALPTPSYSVTRENIEPLHITEVLTGQNLVYTNTTPGNISCFWEFGSGANYYTYSGCNAPTINYSTPGKKFTKLRVTEGACTNETPNGYNPFVVVFNCNPVIPADVKIIKPGVATDDSGYNYYSNIWVCPGASFKVEYTMGHTLFLEPGSNADLNYVGPSDMYIKNLASAKFKYSYGVAIKSEGGSVVGKPQTQLECPTITFDYSKVSCGCYDDENCVTTSVQEEIKSSEAINIFPNPAANDLTISMEDKISSISLFDINGVFIKEFETTNGNRLNLENEKDGIYILKILAGDTVYNKRITVIK